MKTEQEINDKIDELEDRTETGDGGNFRACINMQEALEWVLEENDIKL